MIHHVELYVSDVEKSTTFWELFIYELGYETYQQWKNGISWKKDQTYIVLVQVEERFKEPVYHRCRVGLNHLAFHATSREQVDALREKLMKNNASLLYDERYPYAGGENVYAVFFEDPDRIKIEIVSK